MAKKHPTPRETDWPLVIVAVIMIVIGAVLVWLAIVNATALGWWAFVPGLTGLSTITFAVIAIQSNNRAWILLDLILP